MTQINAIANHFKKLQQHICSLLETADGKETFAMNPWSKDLGSGVSGVIQKGMFIEKGAVNFSHVGGSYTPQMAKLLGEEASSYSATGVSSIIHPFNVHVPIIHMNVRYFELDNGTCWFGGGIDLTPHFVVKADAHWFHTQLKAVCDNINPAFYSHFKPWADDYFYLPHRDETRGIGGIFFDRIKPEGDITIDKLVQFCIELGEVYPQIYAELIKRHGKALVSESELKWQGLRRGRYVEFNLVHDRGTKFGLESGGNTDSILLSMPPAASWEYMYQPKEGSREAETLQFLKKGIDWLEL